MNTIDHALQYLDLGLSAIPIRTGTKIPACRWKHYQQSQPDERMLRDWFARYRCIAIICGAASSGLIVRDFDSHASYGSWAAMFPNLAKSLPTVTTARGCHVWARSESIPSFIEFSDGELRTDGHYVIAPPSTHENGHVYQWSVPLGNKIPHVEPAEVGFLRDFSLRQGPQDDTEDTDSARTTEDTVHTRDSDTQQTQDTQVVNSKAMTVFTFSRETLKRIEDAIKQTMTRKAGTRNSQVFAFARELKAIGQLANLDGIDLEKVVREWHRRSLKTIRTKPFIDTWLEFLTAWDSVRYPAGQGPLHLAMERASRAEVPSCARSFDSESMVLLVKLCRELQQLHGKEPFFIGCREAGKLIGVSHNQASLYLNGLVRLGILTLASRGSWECNKSNEYLYNGD